MGGSDITDFLSQVPIAYILLPLGLGALYVGLMVIIFRRAAQRRRKAREARGEIPAEKPERARSTFSPLNQLKAVGALLQPQRSAANLPEPDLDLLTHLPGGPGNMVSPASNPLSDVVEAEIVSEPKHEFDWMVGVTTTPSQAVNPAVVPQEAVMPAKPTEPAPIEASDVVEVMRIFRDLNDGGLIIQMGNQRYRTLDEVKNPDLARRFTAVVRELWALVGGGSARELPQITPLPPSGAPAQPSGLLSRAGSAESEASKPTRLGRLTQQIRGGGKAAKSEEPKGIADAIEEYLQFRLLNTPDFATRSIHIRPALDTGVSIEVDGHYYESINDVIDADVREFLSTVMKEWEARH